MRVYNCLRASNIESVGELIEWSRADLRKIRGYGSKCVTELEVELTLHGLKLREGQQASKQAKQPQIPLFGLYFSATLVLHSTDVIGNVLFAYAGEYV